MKSLRRYLRILFLLLTALGMCSWAAGESPSLPSALQAIEEEAFANCESLEGVLILPLDVQVDESAFSGDDTATYHNGCKTVPAFLCDPLYVDISNCRELLIDAGYYTEEDFE